MLHFFTNILPFALGQYAPVALYFLSAYFVGMLLYRNRDSHGHADLVLFRTTTGVIASAQLVLVFGLLGILSSHVLWVWILLGIPGVLSSGRSAWSRLAQLKKRGVSASVIIGGLFLILALIALTTHAWLQPLYPLHLFDAMSLHIPFAKTWIAQGEVTRVDALRYPILPILQQLNYTFLLLFLDDGATQIYSFGCLMLMALAVLQLGRNLGGWYAGILSVLVLVSSAVVVHLGSVTLVETGVAMLIMVSLYQLCLAMRSGAGRSFFWAGVFIGAAMASKHNGPLFLILMSLWILIHVMLKGRNRAAVLLFPLAATLIAGPYYLHSYVRVNDPFFPISTPFFDDNAWNEVDHERHARHLETFGVEPTVKNFVTSSFLLSDYRAFQSDHSVSILIRFLAPWVLIWGLFRRGYVRGLSIVLLLYWFIWFEFGAQVLRYLYPAIAILSVLTGLFAATLIGYAGRVFRFPNVFTKAVKLACALSVLILCLYEWHGEIKRRGPLPYNDDTIEAFYERRYKLRPAIEYMNRTYQTDYVLYLRPIYMRYFADGVVLGGVFGPNNGIDILNNEDDVEDTYRKIKERGSSHYLIIRKNNGALIHDYMASEFFTPEYTDEKCVVLKLR